MNIVVDVNHPADVHLFKNFIWNMQRKGHNILVTASLKDISLQLLDTYNIEYKYLGSYGRSALNKIINIPLIDFRMYKAVKDFKPDIFVGMGSVRASHVAKLMGKKSITFEDTEPGSNQNKILYGPFTDVILTPSCFKEDYGKKQIRFKGYKELAYLHPKYFKPNPNVLEEIGIKNGEIFFVVRFVSWSSPHEIGLNGIKNKKQLIEGLESFGRVLITSEGNLDKDLQRYQIKISSEKLHDLLYYATLYIGEGATIASECAVLGTHAIFINATKLGYIDEQEQRYKLVYSFTDSETLIRDAIDKVTELLKNPNLKNDGKIKREKLLADNIDVTNYLIKSVENIMV